MSVKKENPPGVEQTTRREHGQKAKGIIDEVNHYLRIKTSWKQDNFRIEAIKVPDIENLFIKHSNCDENISKLKKNHFKVESEIDAFLELKRSVQKLGSIEKLKKIQKELELDLQKEKYSEFKNQNIERELKLLKMRGQSSYQI